MTTGAENPKKFDAEAYLAQNSFLQVLQKASITPIERMSPAEAERERLRNAARWIIRLYDTTNPRVNSYKSAIVKASLSATSQYVNKLDRDLAVRGIRTIEEGRPMLTSIYESLKKLEKGLTEHESTELKPDETDIRKTSVCLRIVKQHIRYMEASEQLLNKLNSILYRAIKEESRAEVEKELQAIRNWFGIASIKGLAAAAKY